MTELEYHQEVNKIIMDQEKAKRDMLSYKADLNELERLQHAAITKQFAEKRQKYMDTYFESQSHRSQRLRTLKMELLISQQQDDIKQQRALGKVPIN